DVRVHASGEGSSNREVPTAELKKLMWGKAGVIRSGAGLSEALEKITHWHSEHVSSSTRMQIEELNLLTIGDLISRFALAREESRGAHYRSDFPQRNDGTFQTHSTIKNGEVLFE